MEQLRVQLQEATQRASNAQQQAAQDRTFHQKQLADVTAELQASREEYSSLLDRLESYKQQISTLNRAKEQSEVELANVNRMLVESQLKYLFILLNSSPHHHCQGDPGGDRNTHCIQ